LKDHPTDSKWFVTGLGFAIDRRDQPQKSRGRIRSTGCHLYTRSVRWSFKYQVPSGYVKIAMENHHFQWENPLFLWSFSIAMLNYQRVIQIQNWWPRKQTMWTWSLWMGCVTNEIWTAKKVRPKAFFLGFLQCQHISTITSSGVIIWSLWHGF
jgi:hypothetical protein